MKEYKIPIKITPDPIINAVIEIRFKAGLPENAVFGSIYTKLNKNYQEYKNLGIPNEMKQVVPPLKYSAEAEISNEEYIIGIGGNVFYLKINADYKGWNSFYSTFKRDFKILNETKGLVNEIQRVGLRYINLFKNEKDIFNSFKLKIDFADKNIYKTNTTMYRTNLIKDDIFLTLRIEDKVKSSNSEEGLLLDIDSYMIEGHSKLKKEKVIDYIESLHSAEKKLFFRLLEKNFLGKFNPVYDEEG